MINRSTLGVLDIKSNVPPNPMLIIIKPLYWF